MLALATKALKLYVAGLPSKVNVSGFNSTTVCPSLVMTPDMVSPALIEIESLVKPASTEVVCEFVDEVLKVTSAGAVVKTTAQTVSTY